MLGIATTQLDAQTVCASNNPNGGTLDNRRAPNEYAYRATSATPVSIVGFSLYTATTGGTVTVNTAIYAAAAGMGTVCGFWRTFEPG